MDFRVLGPMEVTDGRRRVDLGPRMPRAVLATLVMNANTVVSVDRLIDHLWGEEPPATAMTALQGYVSALRKAIEPDRPPRAPPQVLVTQPPGYLLRAESEAIDAVRFDVLAREGLTLLGAGRPTPAFSALENSLALWRGSPYEELAVEPFAQPEIARLNELRATAAEALAEARLALGRHAEVVADLKAMVAEEPLRERRWQLLALALYRTGRQGEALRSLTRARRILGDELGIDPGPDLQRLEFDVLAQSSSLEWQPPREQPFLATAHTPADATPGHKGAFSERTPLVGRDLELSELDSALEAAARGRGGVALVVGEPGIGKTRLAEELARRGKKHGMAVAWGRCDEGEAAPAYWPWIQILRSLVTDGEPAAVRAALSTGAADLAQIVPDVKELVETPLEPLLLLDPDVARSRLYDAVVGFVVRLADDSPLVVVVDDLHWADPPSLVILRSLAAQALDADLLLVCTYRPVEADAAEAVQATVATLLRMPEVTRVQPGGLTESDVNQLLAVATGAQPRPGVAAAIRARTEGNPLFVSELLRLLSSERKLDESAAEAVRTEIPRAVREVIRRRLARLPTDAVSLLAVAAVIGRDFDFDVVATAGGHDEERALELIEAGLLVGVVIESDSPGSYRFSHSLVRETLYEGLSALRRKRLHQRAGEALEKLRPHDPPVVELAHHFFEAGEVGGDKAFLSALRAAEAAQAGLAYEQAEAQLRRALELLARTPPSKSRDTRELDVQLRLAGLVTMAKGWTAEGVEQAWTRAVELCRQAGQTPQVLASLWGLWVSSLMRGDIEATRRVGSQLSELGRTSGERATLAVSEFSTGYLSLHRGELLAAFEPLRRAAALAGALDHRPLVEVLNVHPGVLALSSLALCCALAGDHDQETELRTKTLDLITRVDHPFSRVVGLVIVGMVDAIRRDVPLLLRGSEEAIEVANEWGFQHYRLFAGVLHGAALAQQGAVGVGTAEIEEALAEIEAGGWLLQRPFFLALLAEALQRCGRVDDALAALDQALRVIEATDERFFEAEVHRLRGEALHSGGLERSTEAVASFQRALTVARAQNARALERRVADSLGGHVFRR